MKPESLSVNSFIYLYYGQPKLMSIQPVSGPMSGGSVVAVRGKGFLVLGTSEHENNVVCIFRSTATIISTPATFVSSDRIECHTPTWTKEESVTIDISLNGVVADRKETTAVVSLESNALQYFYFKHPSLLTISPQRGIFSRSNDVRILVDSDSNLFLPSNASNLICDFGLNDNTTKTIGRVATASNGIDTNNQNT